MFHADRQEGKDEVNRKKTEEDRGEGKAKARAVKVSIFVKER